MVLPGGNRQALLALDGTFLDLLPAAVYVCDATGLIQYFNCRATELWGQTPQYGDTEQRFCGAFRLFYPDGTVMAHASTPMAEALRTGLPQRNKEAIIERPDGSSITVLVNINVMRDEAGAMVGAVNVFQDINILAQRMAERTEALSKANAALQAEMLQHKQAREQLERQQEVLAHREKLAAMGSMLASVAHELNNPLAVVMMQAELLREEAGHGPLATHAAELTQAAGRCVEIVHNFLSLARQHPPKRTHVDLNTVVEAAMKLLAYPLRVDTVTVEYRLADNLPVLWADPHQLQQVVVNLVTNAHQALRETAASRLLTLSTRIDQAQQSVILEVADTGPGIPQAVQARIFEPFFTTKPPGVGTGLGLSFCLGIVEGHGGTMHVDSHLGRGTVFRVELPLVPVPGDMPAPEPIMLHREQGKMILIIDDEAGFTRTLTHLLQHDGHTVETAANGRLALEKCQGQDYQLILCDLRMPVLDGPGFYRALQHRHPHLCPRVVFLTGDTLSPEAQVFLEHAGVPRLTKPFTAAMLRQVIQQTVDSG